MIEVEEVEARIHTGCRSDLLEQWIARTRESGGSVVIIQIPAAGDELDLIDAFRRTTGVQVAARTMGEFVAGLFHHDWPKDGSLVLLADTANLSGDLLWDAVDAAVALVARASDLGRTCVVLVGSDHDSRDTLGMFNSHMVLVSRHPLSQEVQPPGSRIPAIDHRYDDWPESRASESAELSASAVAAGRAWLLLPNSLHLGLSAEQVDRLASGARAVGGIEIVLDLADVTDQPSLMVVLSAAFHTVVPAIDVTAAISLIDLDDLDVEPEYLVTVRGVDHLHGRLLDALVQVLLSTCDRMRSGGRVFICAFEASGNSAEIFDLAAAWNRSYYTRSIDYGRPDDLRPIPLIDHR